MPFIQLRTYIVIMLTISIAVLSAVIVHWITPIFILLLATPLVAYLVFKDIQNYVVHTISLIKNPRAAMAESGFVTQKLPFWLKPFGDHIMSKYANGDYDARIAKLKSAVTRSRPPANT